MSTSSETATEKQNKAKVSYRVVRLRRMSRPERIAETLALANQPIVEAFWQELAEIREKAAHKGRARPET